MNLAVPDVCKTPPAMAPVPYPNMAMAVAARPNVKKLMISGLLAQNFGTQTMISNGDNPGVGLGVISQSVMGPSRWVTGVSNVFVEKLLATRVADSTAQNRRNAVGKCVMPGQTKVLLIGAASGGGGAGKGKGAGKGGNKGKSGTSGSANKGKSGDNAGKASRNQSKNGNRARKQEDVP